MKSYLEGPSSWSPWMLCHCNWMPLSVADWLSSALEAKGIPSFDHIQRLLLLLHPRFCISKAFVKPLAFEDFEEGIHPDADFPPISKDFLKVTEFQESWVENGMACNLDQQWKQKALVYLSSFYDQPDELKELIETLFVLLHQSKFGIGVSKSMSTVNEPLETRSPILEFSELCESLKKSMKYTLNVAELNNNGDKCENDGCNEIGNESTVENSLKKHINMDKSNDTMVDNLDETAHLSHKISTSNSSKEGWECLPGIAEHSESDGNVSLLGSRLFERAGNEWINPAEVQTKKQDIEPWESDTSIWNLETSERKDDQSNSLNNLYESIPFKSLVNYPTEHIHGLEKSGSSNSLCEANKKSGFEPWNLSSNYDSSIGSHNVFSNQPPWGDSQPSNMKSSVAERSIEDQLFESFHQLGFSNIWENDTNESLSLNNPTKPSQLESSFDDSSSYRDTMDVSDHSSLGLELKINDTLVHYGPNGPFVDLHHAETSGFTPVVPQKGNPSNELDFSSKNVDIYNFTEPSNEEENLLTSPRTHFRPIQDNHVSPTEDGQNEDIICFAGLPEAPNPEVVFHRSGSGNLLLENDGIEGSPKKYMIYKETPVESVASSVSPEFNLKESGVEDSSSFIPKFKVVNNEKFCQTEEGTYDMTLKQNKANANSSWPSQVSKDLKRIWGSTNKGEKEVWEVNYNNFDMPPEWSKNSLIKHDDATEARHSADIFSEVWTQPSKSDLGFCFSGLNLTEEKDSVETSLWERSLRQNRFENPLLPVNVTDKPWSPKEFVPQSNNRNNENSETGPQWGFEWESSKVFQSQSSPRLNVSKETSPNAAQLEDLDNLGFEFNYGFEWDQPNEQDGDEENSQEVLVCETEDGQTVYLPIEYLDNDVYDQLFDNDSEMPVGGSLPSLQASQLEQWKKKLSAKLAKRSRSGKSLPPSRRPCSFFLEGNCRRIDCKFSHDLSSITCRFWEEGSCLKGDMCPFYHGYAINQRRRNRSEGDQITEPINILDGQSRMLGKRSRKAHSFELNSEADFPTLGSSYESRANSTEELALVEMINKAATKPKKKKKSSKAGRKETTGALSDSISVPFAKGDQQAIQKGEKSTTKRLPSSVRKVLKTHQDLLSKQTFSCHDDGTVSDF